MKVLKAYPLKRLEKLIEIQECRTLISIEATYDLKHGLKSVEQPINLSISNQSCLCKGNNISIAKRHRTAFDTAIYGKEMAGISFNA